MIRDLEVTPSVVIPADELHWSFSRSSGPGGQSVNTADTRVTLSWNIEHSQALSDPMRMRALGRIGGSTITVTVQRHRSQLRNREEALMRLADQVRLAIAPPGRKRRPTRPSTSSITQRLQSKKRRGQIKRNRQSPDAD